MADIFRAKVIDTQLDSFVFELTGPSSKIDKFVRLMRPLGLTELSRTGVLVDHPRAGVRSSSPHPWGED